MSTPDFNEQIQALLYGKLEVEFVHPTYVEQLEIVRALAANPSAFSRLQIKGTSHPWFTRLLAGFRAQAAQAAQAAYLQVRFPPSSQ